jgi:hypothetical protein
MQGPDPRILLELLTATMPYGKYKGVALRKLPVPYLEWFAREGFPKNRLGVLLETMHVIRQEHLEFLLNELERQHRK